jgi:hypothetical protein
LSGTDGRSRAFQAVNVALIETYWAVDGYLSRKVAGSGLGKGVVRELAELADLKLAPPVRELHQDVADTFKDTYLLDFLNLSEPHLMLVNISQ